MSSYGDSLFIVKNTTLFNWDLKVLPGGLYSKSWNYLGHNKDQYRITLCYRHLVLVLWFIPSSALSALILLILALIRDFPDMSKRLKCGGGGQFVFETPSSVFGMV